MEQEMEQELKSETACRLEMDFGDAEVSFNKMMPDETAETAEPFICIEVTSLSKHLSLNIIILEERFAEALMSGYLGTGFLVTLARGLKKDKKK